MHRHTDNQQSNKNGKTLLQTNMMQYSTEKTGTSKELLKPRQDLLVIMIKSKIIWIIIEMGISQKLFSRREKEREWDYLNNDK